MPTCKVKMSDCQSSQVRRFGYDPERQTLAVQFIQGKDRDKTSPPYEYGNVTPEQFEDFSNAPSKGTWFGANLKKATDAHPYSKILETPEERAERKRQEQP